MAVTHLITAQQAAEEYSISLAVAETSLNRIRNGESLFLAVSGKIGAGKDTVAPLLAEELSFEASHESFARPLRDEVNLVIQIIRESVSEDDAINTVISVLKASNVEPVIHALFDDVKKGVVKDSFIRTPTTRKALQWWGTEVRRTEDEHYWVKKAMNASLHKIAEGGSIFVTDARFPNEVDAILKSFGSVVRLTVSPDEQARRIKLRDGQEPNPEAINHDSETALDAYKFPITIDTDVNKIPEVVTLARKAIQESFVPF